VSPLRSMVLNPLSEVRFSYFSALSLSSAVATEEANDRMSWGDHL
jgi:hypothetical protein